MASGVLAAGEGPAEREVHPPDGDAGGPGRQEGGHTGGRDGMGVVKEDGVGTVPPEHARQAHDGGGPEVTAERQGPDLQTLGACAALEEAAFPTRDR
jgi:hypothetical protein